MQEVLSFRQTFYPGLRVCCNDEVLAAYFDETNINPDQRVPMVAGYIASTFQWRRFSEQWDKLLRRANVPVDPKCRIRLVHRYTLQQLQPPFQNWTATERDKFLIKAYAIIRRHTRMPVGNAVFREHFENITSKSLQTTLGGAYGWCAYTCLLGVKAYCDRYHYEGPVEFVFENGAPGQAQVKRVFDAICKHEQSRRYFRVGSISFAGKDVLQLQAADFLAYDLGRYASDYELGRTRFTVNAYLHQLLGPTKPKDSEVRFWDEDALRKHTDALNEARLFQD
jgi:hypothetical protein